MSEAKIEFTIGAISFIGEGDEDWLASQLDKILEKAPKLMELAPSEQTKKEAPSDSQQTLRKQDSIARLTLPNFLREKNATTNQNRKFLATAVWLTTQGNIRLTTRDITQALKDSNQSRLGNASESLNQNVGKGYCEKDGKQFFVTQEGKDSL